MARIESLSEDEKRSKELTEWRGRWDALFLVTRYIITGYAAVAIASLTGIGNAGDAPGVLDFYFNLLGLCTQTMAVGAVSLAVVHYYRGQMSEDWLSVPPRLWFYRVIFRHGWLEKLQKALPPILQLLFLGLVSSQVLILLWPVKFLMENRREIRNLVVCESEQRAKLEHPAYLLTDDCKAFLGVETETK